MDRSRIKPTATMIPALSVLLLSALCATTEFAAQPGGDLPGVISTSTLPSTEPSAVTPPAPDPPCAGALAMDTVAPSDAASIAVEGDTDSSDAKLDYCPATPVQDKASPLSENARRHGYCRCSCGYPCRTSTDCGGVSCDPFITCC